MGGFALRMGALAAAVGLPACRYDVDRLAGDDGATAVDSASGDATSDARSPDGQQVPCLPPPNDTADTALDVGAGGSFCFELGGAIDDKPSACSCGNGRDLFFTMNLPDFQTIYVDTVGSDVPLEISVYRSACSPIADMAPGCASFTCLNEAQLLHNAGPGPVCIVIDETSPGSGPARARVRFELLGHPSLPLGPAAVDVDSCLALGGRNDWTTTGCGPSPGNDVTYAFTVCPGETLQLRTDVTSCSPVGREVIASHRHASGELLCDRGTCGAPNPVASLATTGLAGPRYYRIVLDSTAGCGQTNTSIVLSP